MKNSKLFPCIILLGCILLNCLKFPIPEPKRMVGYFSVDEIPIRMGEDWNQIRRLELHNSGFSDEDLERIPPMKKLESLHLGGTSVKSLKHLNKNHYPNLATLYLENTPITDRSFQEWVSPPVVTKLVLEGTKISNLKWAIKFPKLRHLDIQGTKVDSLEGLEHCPGIVNLWLGWTNVKDLSVLFNRKDLVYISIDFLRIYKSHIRDFRKSNPYTKVVRFIHPQQLRIPEIPEQLKP